MQIRRATEADIPRLLVLMRELACFEKYIDAFAVTEDVLREQGFRRSPPDFHCFVAEENNDLVGMLVYYFVPFTDRAKPKLIIKELYVSESHRHEGIGRLLMKTVAEIAAQSNCGVIKWQVAPWNVDGIRFYERLGATINRDWIELEMSEKSFRDLATS
ncbi:MAG: GNAT family N-acetyltransferase [Verrucomicrobiota bacterium]|nr:GNAT family N-acetyltransferase [Verrucomicrobiota bacterium]